VTYISLQLQPLTATEIPQVLALDQACFGGLWTKDGYLREMESPNSTLLILPAPTRENSLMALGCCWSIVEEAHVTIMAVHPDFQGQGLGQLILLGLLRDAWLRGLERATLEVRESNTAAIALYEKFGFTTAGRRKKYYQATGEDALIMWRKGLDHSQFPQQLEEWGGMVGDRLAKNQWSWRKT
jgi:ribosomal-protein-alanine N-acetyltransferase